MLVLGRFSSNSASALVMLAGVVTIAPFLLLSSLGGQWADRYDKALIARRLALARLLLALLASLGFAVEATGLLFVTLAGFGMISALFGPIKFGILPDHLDDRQLAPANALVEGSTFVAILLGSIGGSLTAARDGRPDLFTLGLVGCALLGWLAARRIPPTCPAPAVVIDRNLLRGTAVLLRDLYRDRRLARLGVMISLFWLAGAVTLSLLPPLVRLTLGGSEVALSLTLTLFVVSIAAGSGLGGLPRRRALRLVPLAGLLMALAGAVLGALLAWLPPLAPAADLGAFLARPPIGLIAGGLALLALAGGLFIVPLVATAQQLAPRQHCGRMVGAVNVLSALFMVAGGSLVSLMQAAGVPLAVLFALIGGIGLFAAIDMSRALRAGGWQLD